MKTEFSKIVDILGIEGDLGNKIHTKLIYLSDKEQQKKYLNDIKSIIKIYEDSKLRNLAYNSKTKFLIEKLIKIRNDKNRKIWMNIVLKFLKGLKFLLEREIRKGEHLKINQNEITRLIKKLEIYNKGDILEIKQKGNELFVNYICLKLSPEYKRKFEPWRDTQFKFAVYLDKGLFVWLYININKKYRNKGLGTKLVKIIENMISKQGIKRFSVEYPNRPYWRKKVGYEIPNKLCIGKAGYSLEGYKELR